MIKCFCKGFGGSCKFDFIEFNFDTVNIHFVLVQAYIDTLFNEFSTSVESKTFDQRIYNCLGLC